MVSWVASGSQTNKELLRLQGECMVEAALRILVTIVSDKTHVCKPGGFGVWGFGAAPRAASMSCQGANQLDPSRRIPVLPC